MLIRPLSIVGKLDLVSGSSERRIVFRQIPLGIVSMGRCFVERVPRCEQLAPGIPGLGRRLAGRVVRAERPVLGVPGKGTNRLVGAAVLLLDLGDINAVRGVFSECLPAKGINGASDIREGALRSYCQSWVVLSSITGDLAGLVAGSRNARPRVTGIIIPLPVLQRFLHALEDPRGRIHVIAMQSGRWSPWCSPPPLPASFSCPNRRYCGRSETS